MHTRPFNTKISASLFQRQIAATARRYGLPIVTGNDRDFRRPGLKVFNPFKEQPSPSPRSRVECLPSNSESRTVGPMSGFRARVEKGRLLLDEPTTLPEGTVLHLVADDEGDDLTDDERRALHEALSVSRKSAEAGRLRPASATLDELRGRR